MATSSELDRVSMVVLRYMRKPIFVLVFVYAVVTVQPPRLSARKFSCLGDKSDPM